MKPVDILTMNKTSWEQSAERFFGAFGPAGVRAECSE